MLDTRNDALFLYAPHKGGAHLAQMEGVFAVCFLASSPSGIVGKIDTYAGRQIPSVGQYLLCHGLPDFFFQVRIEGSPAQHGHRKAGAFSIAADNAPWTVAEKDGGDSFFRDSSCGVGKMIIVFLCFLLDGSPYFLERHGTAH